PVEMALPGLALRRRTRIEQASDRWIDRWPLIEPGPVIAHRDDEDKAPRSGVVEHAQHLPREIGIGAVGRPRRASERLGVEKRVEAERRHRQVAAEKAGAERVQTDRAVARLAQAPSLRGDG